jgi:hypothetical protein
MLFYMLLTLGCVSSVGWFWVVSPAPVLAGAGGLFCPFSSFNPHEQKERLRSALSFRYAQHSFT